MGPFLRELCEATGFERALPMNTGAEAVETAIKMVRKWGYQVKGVAADEAEIIVCENNFHGRTTTIVGFSSEAQYKDGFGPFTPGFKEIPYGDAKALEAAITKNTVGFLVEPLQGEGGGRGSRGGLPEEGEGALHEAPRGVHRRRDPDGLGRTGRLFCCEWEDVRPDVLIVGKALGGGVYPVSAAIADSEYMDVFHPGDHGSTFGGNPLGAAVARASLRVILDEKLRARRRARHLVHGEAARHRLAARGGGSRPRAHDRRGDQGRRAASRGRSARRSRPRACWRRRRTTR
jgi:ornithine--oxo-acid transaminase